MPGLHVWRPCDEVESLVAWAAAIERREGPTCLLLSRQGLPGQARDSARVAAISRGGYVLRDCEGDPEALVVATGSEVQLAVQAAEKLSAEGRRVRVISMPCLEVFENQDRAYRETVLPSEIGSRVIVEATVTLPWQGYAGPAGRVIGIDRFGESAPGGVLMETFGFTVERVVEALREVIRM
jgi:transketolase